MPELADIFEREEKLQNEIGMRIKAYGYDGAAPIVTDRNKNLVDGHTRYYAAKSAGLSEIPVVEKDFAGIEEMIRYAKDRQLVRRNLTQAQVFEYANGLGVKGSYDGGGRAVEKLADKLGVSKSTVINARTVGNSMNEEEKKEFENELKEGKTTINKKLTELRGGKKKVKKGKEAPVEEKIEEEIEEEKEEAGARESFDIEVEDDGYMEEYAAAESAEYRFVKRAVEILLEYGEHSAAEVLIEGFELGEGERERLEKLMEGA